MSELQDDEVMLWDFVVESIAVMDADEKQMLSKVLLLLLACEEDGQLQMARVATLLEHLTGGALEFNRG